MSEFKIAIPDYWKLTPRQVADVYFHPRDAEGKVVAPKAPTAPVDELTKLRQIRALAPALCIPPDQIARLDAAIAAEVARRAQPDREPPGADPRPEHGGGPGP